MIQHNCKQYLKILTTLKVMINLKICRIKSTEDVSMLRYRVFTLPILLRLRNKGEVRGRLKRKHVAAT
jgi:hypothetical protein